MKGTPRNPPGRRKPPEENGKPKEPAQTNKSEKVAAKAAPRQTMEVVIEKRPKPRPKATVEEVEDVEDRPPEKSVKNRELPYRNVVPVEDSVPDPVLPRRPNINKPKNFSAPVTQEKAYQVSTDLDNAEAVRTIRKVILDTEVPMKVRWVLAASAALQKDLNQLTTKRRKPVVQTTQSKVNQDVQNFTVRLVEEDSEGNEILSTESSSSGNIEENVEETLRDDAIDIRDLPYDQYVMIMPHDLGSIPEGALIVDDPVVQYLESLAPEEKAKEIIAGLSSAALRCVYPLVNRSAEVEAILDSGSQICSMSEEEATRLKVPWDPDVRILMQSANGSVEKTLGLARNIPCTFSGLTVYLQIHILRSAPYKALLGRPFEILTESMIKNSRDGSQTITMTDQYGGSRITIPTHERGKVRNLQRTPRSDNKAEGSPDSEDF